MPGGRLTPRERQRIAAGLADRLTYAEIARRLGRPTSTVSREVGRNGGPRDYRPREAQAATAQRSRRGAPSPARGPRTSTVPPNGPHDPRGPGGTGLPGTASGDTTDGAMNDAVYEEIIELVVGSGLPRMTARVHVDLLLAEDGRRTAAELVRRLKVSPASVSVSVNYLLQHGYIRRERDPLRRCDIYVLDDEGWYHSIAVSAQRTLEMTHAALAAADRLGPGTPVGQRLTRGGTFLDRVATDMMESARHWCHLLS
ncbi:MarR family transcriptional regulator [Streptomyces sp. NPDC058657]|uniref:MarR family transcriptional regulator n=1 Tax=unclassified Streptomyces TaxID=2593676 RepID=UPI00365E2A04